MHHKPRVGHKTVVAKRFDVGKTYQFIAIEGNNGFSRIYFFGNVFNASFGNARAARLSRFVNLIAHFLCIFGIS